MQNEKPSNTREQCAFDRGVYNKKLAVQACQANLAKVGVVDKWREVHNPHKKGSAEHKFWNEGFDSV
jgi:hypothetical protein